MDILKKRQLLFIEFMPHYCTRRYQKTLETSHNANPSSILHASPPQSMATSEQIPIKRSCTTKKEAHKASSAMANCFRDVPDPLEEFKENPNPVPYAITGTVVMNHAQNISQ